MKTDNMEIIVRTEKAVSRQESEALALEITNNEELVVAVNMLSHTNKMADKVKAEKEKITRPLLDALSVERARWKPIETMCSNVVEILKGKMSMYQKRIDAETKAKEQKIIDRVERGTLKAETAVNKLATLPNASENVISDAGMIQWREVQKLVIEDAMLIPREYLTVNEVAVRDALKNGKQVPGAHLESEKTPVNYR